MAGVFKYTFFMIPCFTGHFQFYLVLFKTASLRLTALALHITLLVNNHFVAFCKFMALSVNLK